MPTSLQMVVINLGHEGHQGIVKTKMFLWQKVWFPGIGCMVERKITGCIPCQAMTPQHYKQDLSMLQLPNGIWEEVSVDFCGGFPLGESLLVIMDDYSCFPVVRILNSTSANVVISKLDNVFATYGTPRVLCSDNGPPFNSYEFCKFAENLGFKHRKITPHWP